MTSTGTSTPTGRPRRHRRPRLGLAATAAATGLIGLIAVAAPASASTAGVQPGFQFPAPTISLAKSASIPYYSATGTPITYTYQVTNDGDATLDNVTVTDPMTGLSPIDCGGGSSVIPELDVGASQACTATYTTTPGDVKAGSITNVGTATGSSAAGQVSDNASLTIPQKGKPFSCTVPIRFLSESTSATGPTTIYGSTGPTTYAPLPVNPYAHTYNAIGFDPSGPGANFIFGMGRVSGGNHLLRIDGTGAIANMGTVTGFPATTAAFPAVGAFDGSGNYWVTKGGTSATAYEINVSTKTLVQPAVTLSAVFKPFDWTWAQGFLWGLSGKHIYRVLTVSPFTVSVFTLPFTVAPGTYGAAWTLSNGNPQFSNNQTGQIDQIAVANPTGSPPTFTLVPPQFNGPANLLRINDGTSCIGKGTDLGTSSTGPATAAAGSTVAWNVTVANGGPGNSSGFALVETTKGVTGVTTDTPGCSVTAKTLQVECAEGELDNGDAFTVTLSGTLPKTPGKCVVSTSTVTGNEADANPGNNTSAVRTCIEK